jgi:hypothetical protein
MLFESVATAIKLWFPFATVVEFQCAVYGDDPVTGSPIFTPSTWNCTEDIAAGLVADAVELRVTDDPDTGAPARGAVIDTVGGGAAGVVTLTMDE